MKRLDQDQSLGDVMSDFPEEKMLYLQNSQLRAVKYVDRLIKNFVTNVPQNTHIIVTSDHGELFGENGFFGHGPICHPKVNEVPFIEFRRDQIIL